MPKELHTYWTNSSYYGKAMGIGDIIFTSSSRYNNIKSLRNHPLLDCRIFTIEEEIFECEKEV
jgi:hypothetical protein